MSKISLSLIAHRDLTIDVLKMIEIFLRLSLLSGFYILIYNLNVFRPVFAIPGCSEQLGSEQRFSIVDLTLDLSPNYLITSSSCISPFRFLASSSLRLLSCTFWARKCWQAIYSKQTNMKHVVYTYSTTGTGTDKRKGQHALPRQIMFFFSSFNIN